jgi:hypothetical protein
LSNTQHKIEDNIQNSYQEKYVVGLKFLPPQKVLSKESTITSGLEFIATSMSLYSLERSRLPPQEESNMRYQTKMQHYTITKQHYTKTAGLQPLE